MEKKSLKIISIGLAVLLLLSIITIAILATLLVVRTQDVIDFSNPNTEIQKEQTYALSNVNFKSVSDVNQSNIQTVNVVAKIKPFNASDKRLKWTTSWANANSEWANGKVPNDYVSIIVDNEDSRKAKITLLEAFGEIIVLTVTSVSNPEISKSVEIRCIADLDFVTTFEFGGVEYSFNKEGFSNGSKVLILQGDNYNYPTGNKDSFKIKTTLYCSKTYTNNLQEAFVTFTNETKYDGYLLSMPWKYHTKYEYINDQNKKIPIIENGSTIVVNPTLNEDSRGDGYIDPEKFELVLRSIDDLVFDVLNSAFKGTNSNKENYHYVEMKFLGDGASIKLLINLC